jgi:hypothetical protein
MPVSTPIQIPSPILALDRQYEALEKQYAHLYADKRIHLTSLSLKNPVLKIAKDSFKILNPDKDFYLGVTMSAGKVAILARGQLPTSPPSSRIGLFCCARISPLVACELMHILMREAGCTSIEICVVGSDRPTSNKRLPYPAGSYENCSALLAKAKKLRIVAVSLFESDVVDVAISPSCVYMSYGGLFRKFHPILDL